MEPRSWLFLASVTLGGFCTSLFAYHAYYNNKKRSLKSSAAAAVDKKKREIELTIDQGHLDWLKKCTEEFSLPSVDKALRVLLTYAQHAANDMLIFEQIRCIFCNDKQKVSSKYIIDYAHDQYLSEMVSKHKLADKDKAVRIIIDYAMTSDDEATIFEVKRCNHVGICKNC